MKWKLEFDDEKLNIGENDRKKDEKYEKKDWKGIVKKI